ncbi:light-harvesting protein [Paracoccaceae bacterium Fryx2]|nr:light-harvesting protein [Paracoccaceae bacterium Fryx2]
MTNGKIWLVVKPTTGIPLFLTAVAVSSFLVHLALVTNTPWLQNFYNGVPMTP